MVAEYQLVVFSCRVACTMDLEQSLIMVLTLQSCCVDRLFLCSVVNIRTLYTLLSWVYVDELWLGGLLSMGGEQTDCEVVCEGEVTELPRVNKLVSRPFKPCEVLVMCVYDVCM